MFRRVRLLAKAIAIAIWVCVVPLNPAYSQTQSNPLPPPINNPVPPIRPLPPIQNPLPPIRALPPIQNPLPPIRNPLPPVHNPLPPLGHSGGVNTKINNGSRYERDNSGTFNPTPDDSGAVNATPDDMRAAQRDQIANGLLETRSQDLSNLPVVRKMRKIATP